MRKARESSSTGIYHVMIQGVNKLILFFDDEDYDYFVKILRIVKEKYTFDLYAFCLMDNHVHFLIKASKDELAAVMKSIQIRYHYWYRRKYDYEGHLFNNRYKSVPVESQDYFQNLLRYIHNNPVKAQICPSPLDYVYSSIKCYIHNDNDHGLIDTDKAFHHFGDITPKSILDFILQKNDFECMDIKEKAVSDSDAIQIIKKILSTLGISSITQPKDSIQKQAIKQIKKAQVTIAQFRRFTGLPFKLLKTCWA